MDKQEVFETDIVLPSNIRELAYIHSKNYDMTSYKDYLYSTVSDVVLHTSNKESIIYELLKRYKVDYIKEWLQRLEVYDE